MTMVTGYDLDRIHYIAALPKNRAEIYFLAHRRELDITRAGQ